MRTRTLPLALLLLATGALAGCTTTYNAYPPGYPSGHWEGFGAAMAMLVFLVLVVVVLALAVVAVLAILAVAGRGPAAQVAGALLLVLGLLWAVAAMGDGNPFGLLIGALLAVLGALALAPARTQDQARTIVLGER